MMRTLLNVFIFLCKVDAVSMLVINLFSGYFETSEIVMFLKKHKILSIVYLVLGTLGLMFTIFEH